MTSLSPDASAGAGSFDADLCEVLESAGPARASDVHVSAGSAPLLRIDGVLHPVAGAPWSAQKVDAALRSLLSAPSLARFERNLELDLAISLRSGRRFRVNLFRERGATAGAFRIVPTVIPALDELGLPPQVARLAELPRGLVLVTGPTGSGKSTTLAALIHLINRTQSRHVMTVEDPIEFIHTNERSLVQQREIGSDTRSFPEALRRILRQDPDIIMVSDLRDLETIEFALTAADTGHLVFATLHTQGAAQTVDRLIDVFPGVTQAQVRTQLASALQGVVSQTLLPKSSGIGRTVATEVMFHTPAIANLIREQKSYQLTSILMTRRDEGMVAMDQSLAELVNSGEVAYQAALARAYDLDTFRQLVRRRES